MDKDELAQLLADEGLPWHVWDGLNGLCYARRRKTSPPLVVRDENWPGVLEQIRAKEGGLR